VGSLKDSSAMDSMLVLYKVQGRLGLTVVRAP
jgi:hypothetical protein